MDGLTTDESRILGRMHAECEGLRAERDDLLGVLRETLRVLATPAGLPDRGKGRTAEQQRSLDAAMATLAKHEGK